MVRSIRTFSSSPEAAIPAGALGAITSPTRIMGGMFGSFAGESLVATRGSIECLPRCFHRHLHQFIDSSEGFPGMQFAPLVHDDIDRVAVFFFRVRQGRSFSSAFSPPG